MTEIERILDQLERAYEGEAWHGPSSCGTNRDIEEGTN